ncbi:hypothetical protein CVD28_08720 [Bacillus sp. M6-12]|uniref:hypothetical protein n=1 Tax=Bacillus sp. M6-12 TaxID=2054166 RepID=UPI000C76F0B1|nr:hypothetical protein [Bacillus sp. M6-12]PLS17775.1 hypothetical protein CVD28_08720 [Bacillus sp. M6-12]
MGKSYAAKKTKNEERYLIVHEAVSTNSGSAFIPATFFDALQQVRPQSAKSLSAEQYRLYPMKDISTISIHHPGMNNIQIKFETVADKILISEEKTEYSHDNPSNLYRALEYIMIKHNGVLSFFSHPPAASRVTAIAKRPLRESGL